MVNFSLTGNRVYDSRFYAIVKPSPHRRGTRGKVSRLLREVGRASPRRSPRLRDDLSNWGRDDDMYRSPKGHES